ncbi:unnamed protein product [Oreochromis niloticus]|nr:unnamed protein product [Mustela putorius furo]
MEELHRILDKDNANFINELEERWHDFCQKVQFFGVWKKMLKPPMGMDKAEQALEILRVLPSLFPSTSAPPKRVRNTTALVRALLGLADAQWEGLQRGLRVRGHIRVFPRGQSQVCDGDADDFLLHFLLCLCSSDVMIRPLSLTCRKRTNQRPEGSEVT